MNHHEMTPDQRWEAYRATLVEPPKPEPTPKPVMSAPDLTSTAATNVSVRYGRSLTEEQLAAQQHAMMQTQFALGWQRGGDLTGQWRYAVQQQLSQQSLGGRQALAR